MKFTSTLFALFLAMATLAQTGIKASDLKTWLGNWEGNYTYKSETTGETITAKASVKLGPIVNGHKIAFSEKWVLPQGGEQPDIQPKSDTIRISEDGNYVNHLKLASRKKSTDQFQFVLESEGEDAGQKAEIRISYVFIKNKFTLKKEVRYRGESEYFTRHEYKLTRK